MFKVATQPKKSFSIWLLAFILLSLSSSCISNRKIVYFPNEAYNTESLTLLENEPKLYKLQPRDILSIKIKTMDDESSEFFNAQPIDNMLSVNQTSLYLSGYSIDANGNISLPEIGDIKVAGLTVDEAQQKIKDKVGDYLNNVNVLVKLVSFKITVLGEVQQPGHFYIYNNQSTILEGLGMAGDLTDFGNRENITLIRQTKDGPGAVLVNLKDPEVLSSEFYYLQPNDVIYVQPLKAKNARSNLSTLGVLSIIFGAVSTAILILNYVQE